MIRSDRNGQANLAQQDRGEPLLESRMPEGGDRRQQLRETIAELTPSVEVVEKTLNVCLGTSAIAIGSRLKQLSRELGSNHLVEYVAMDSNESAQSGADGWDSFEDSEFLRITTDRVGLIIENASAHEEIVEQIGLNEPEMKAFIQRLNQEGVAQASQVRPYGYLSFLLNFTGIESMLKRKIASLNGAHAVFEKQRAAKKQVQVKRRMTIRVFFTCCGGTGSALAMPVLALLRHLTKQLPVEIDVVMVLPNAFDNVMDGKPEQIVRLDANAAATFRELHGAYAGVFDREGVQIGPDPARQIPIPCGLFNQLFVVGRELADGRDLHSPEAIFDTVAAYFAALSTDLLENVATDEDNRASLRGLTPDPLTGAIRYVSSLGAQAIVLPVDRMSDHFAALQTIELLQRVLLGTDLDDGAAQSKAEDWLGEPLAGDATVLDAAELPAALTRCVLPVPNVVVRPLYKKFQGKERLHHRNAKFAQCLQRQMSIVKDTHLPQWEAQIAETSGSLADEIRKSFAARIDELLESDGLRAAQQFGECLIERCEAMVQALKASSEQDWQMASKSREKMKEDLVPLEGGVRRMLTNRSKQDQVAGRFQAFVVSAVSHAAKEAAARLIRNLLAEVRKHVQTLSQAVEAASTSLQRFQENAENSRAGDQLTTRSLAELDASTPETDRRNFDRLRNQPSEVLVAYCQATKQKKAAAIRLLAGEPAELRRLAKSVRHEMRKKLQAVSLIEVLYDQLNNSDTRAGALAIFEQATVGCVPLWRAESGQANVEYDDALHISIPESVFEGKHKAVVSALMQAASNRIHINGQYNGAVSTVRSKNPHRISVIRGTRGACLHYLPDVLRAQRHYDQWMQSGGHQVHLFREETVMKLPPVIPLQDASEGESSFAIALAMGWVASRGPHWYWNLEGPTDALGDYVCSLASHWDGIAFAGMSLCRTSLMETLMESGRFSYLGNADAGTTARIGHSLKEAMDTVVHNGEMLELVREAYDELRAVAGDRAVAEAWDQQAKQLRLRCGSNRSQASHLAKMADVLGMEADRLRGSRVSRKA